MTRGLGSTLVTDIEADEAEVVHFIDIDFDGGNLTWTTASYNIPWDGKTWTAIGGALDIQPLKESTGERDQGASLELSGVNQSIISSILNNQFRGRDIAIWVAHVDPSDGSVVGDPIKMFRGFQNSEWSVDEERSPKDSGPGTVRVTSNIQSRLFDQKDAVGIQQNLRGHQTVHDHFKYDQFFEFVRDLNDREVDWGGS